MTLPFHLGILGGRQTAIEIGNCLVKDGLLLFFLLLELERLGLEHGELGDSGEHLARKLGTAGFVLVDLLSNFKRSLATVKGLGSELLSELGDLLVDELLLEKRFFLVV